MLILEWRGDLNFPWMMFFEEYFVGQLTAGKIKHEGKLEYLLKKSRKVRIEWATINGRRGGEEGMADPK